MDWRVMKFDDVVEDISGGNIKTPQKEYLSSGKYPIVDQGKELIGGYSDNKDVLFSSKLPVVVFGDHTQCFKYIDFPFGVGADGVKILKPKINIDTKYLYYYLKSRQFPTSGYDRHFKYLKRMDIKFPLQKNEQEKVVNVLDKVNGLLEKRRQSLAKLDQLAQSIFLDMFGDPATNPQNWAVKPFSELCDISNEMVDPTLPEYKRLIHIGGANIESRTGQLTDLKTAEEDLIKSTKFLIDEKMILFSKIRPKLEKVAFPQMKALCSADIYPLIPKTDVCDTAFLISYLRTPYFTKIVSDIAESRANIPKVNREELASIKMACPPLEFQRNYRNSFARLNLMREWFLNSEQRLQILLQSLMQKFFGG